MEIPRFAYPLQEIQGNNSFKYTSCNKPLRSTGKREAGITGGFKNRQPVDFLIRRYGFARTRHGLH
jgi:hypothetical protein